MNEEEKQAIKELKHFTNMTVFWKEKEYTSHEIDNCINIVLHLIDDQQKELEELKHFKKEVNEIIKYADDTAEPTYWNIRKLLGLGENTEI